jgi:flavin reductase (DIM6/NTAB) family NADH-FMN oxidoreductase RutF
MSAAGNEATRGADATVDAGMHFYEPAQGHGLKHSPFNSMVAPRPIGWISTRAADGTLNLAPFSFFNAFNYTPPIVGFCSTGSETRKDSHANAEDTGEFCWNLVTADLAEAMNATSAAVGPEVDEFALAGLTPAESRIVQAPHVAGAKVVFECRTTQVVPLTGADGSPTTATVVFGEVVGVHVDRGCIDEHGVFRTELADPVTRGGGPTAYYRLGERFDMRRPG